MNEYEIIRIGLAKEYLDEASLWFHQKWQVPRALYLSSMQDSFINDVPKWYLVLFNKQIIQGQE